MADSGTWLVHDHLRFELKLAECQAAIEVEDWATGESSFEQLAASLRAHIAMEEEVLYPAYESNPDFPQAPAIALREQHGRIFELLADFRTLLETRNSEHGLESLGPLEQVLFKHHQMEEEVFLPMAGYLLRPKMEELIAELEAFDPN
jgi:hypothetical protein